jgi:hypothetical protein
MRFAFIGGLATTCLAATAAVQAADYTKLNIKPGLWEVSSNPTVTGQMPIPEEELAKLTPEQRARMEAAMKNYATPAAKPRVYKECMTAEKIAKGFPINAPDAAPSCKRKIVSSTASELTLHDECDKGSQKTVSDMHFNVKSGTHVDGTLKVIISSSDGKKTMTVNSNLQGKWLGADCGSVKDSELEK